MPSRPVAALVTRTLVDRDDQGFTHPTKPIGRYLPREQAQTLIDHGQVWEDRGEKGWRRVVASPEPLEVLDVGPARVAARGRPRRRRGRRRRYPRVCASADGRLRGVEAVIDKDLTAAAARPHPRRRRARHRDRRRPRRRRLGHPGQRDLGRVTLAEMARYAADGQFASGSMGPKVDAAMRFVAGGGPRSVITSLTHITDAVEGGFGTVIEPD